MWRLAGTVGVALGGHGWRARLAGPVSIVAPPSPGRWHNYEAQAGGCIRKAEYPYRESDGEDLLPIDRHREGMGVIERG